MGLENLKSAFSNITTFAKSVDKTVKEVSSDLQTDVTTMVSNYSILASPQEVDYMHNEKASGFSANQLHKSPSLFTGVGGTFSIDTHPQEVDYMHNEKASGFSANQLHKSPSKFIGVNGVTWNNNSSYGIGTEPQEVNFFTSEPIIPGFTAGFMEMGGGLWGNSKFKDIPTTRHDVSNIQFTTQKYFGNDYGINQLGPHKHDISGFDSGFLNKGTGEWGNSKFKDIETEMYSVGKYAPTPGIYNFSTQQSDGNNYEITQWPPHSTEMGGFTSGFLNRGTEVWGNSKFKNIESQYQTSFGGYDTYNNGASWLGDDTNLENSSWYFTDNQKRSKPQGFYIHTSHQLGEGDLTFEHLYNNNQTSTDNKYGPHLTIHDSKTGYRWSNPFIAGLFGYDGSEPYVFHEKGSTDKENTSQLNPFNRNAADAFARTTMFIGSTAGILHIVKQNLMGAFQRYRPWYTSLGTIAASILPAEGLIVPLLTPARDFPADLVGDPGGLGDGRGANYSDYLKDRNNIVKGNDKIADDVLNKLNKPLGVKAFEFATSFGSNLLLEGIVKSDSIFESQFTGEKPKLNAVDNVNKSLAGEIGNKPLKVLGDVLGIEISRGAIGDIMTTTPIVPDLTTGGRANDLNSPKFGMPFYFKDLRDDRYITFRAYIEGLNETISPTWNSETYIGRSEPVYTYTNSEREIQFNLKLFAQTKDELDVIYQKMNRLTSLCYPEYTTIKESLISDVDMDAEGVSVYGKSLDKVRMKPPIVQFRLGELFGGKSAEMTGFIKSLSYTFPDNSPWEIDEGRRVPKYIEVTLGYQVIHTETPSLRFTQKTGKFGVEFYGINQNKNVGVQ